MRLQIIQPDARFSCGSCGACCDQPWRTVIEADKAKALLAHDFSKYRHLGGRQFYQAPADGRAGFFDLAKGEGNRCLFLDTDGLCIIHKELGPAAKPGMCQQFPLIASRTWTDERITLNYACPSVQGERGAPLVEQADDIKRVVPGDEKPVVADVRVPLDGATTLSLDESEALLERLCGFFDAGDGPIGALARSLAAVAMVREWQRSGEKGTLLERITSDPFEPTPKPNAWDQPAAPPLSTRMLFAATLQPDTVPAGLSGSLGFMGRLAMIPKLMALASFSGAYPSRVLARNVRIDEVMGRSLSGEIDEASSRLLGRYIRSRIWARTLVGTRLSILGGLHQHVLDLCAVYFFARAAAGSAERPTFEHVRLGLAAVEFHLANQPRVHEQVLRGWFRAQSNQPPAAQASLGLLRAMSSGRLSPVPSI